MRKNGSLITRDGTVIGSELIAQKFARDDYFHPRPSAADSNGYDATASGGSNLGPTNPDLLKRLQADAATYRWSNHTTGAIPAHAITMSGSGLDPDISPANAMMQVGRVARARRKDPRRIAALVAAHIRGRDWGVFGEPRVNVLQLNLAMDEEFPAR